MGDCRKEEESLSGVNEVLPNTEDAYEGYVDLDGVEKVVCGRGGRRLKNAGGLDETGKCC